MFKQAVAIAAIATGAQAYKSDTDLIKDGEGLRLCTYKDTMGIKTVCYGFNLERGSSARSRVEAAGENYDRLNNVGACTTQAVCDKLLSTEVQNARNIVQQQYGNTISCPAAKAVIVDMAYNLGSGGLAQFKNFKSSIQAGRWAEAADGLSYSLYCKQVGTRCTRNQKQIKSC